MAKSKFSTNSEALDAIYCASGPLFAKHGFHGVSIRQVASAVGVSIATIYHHFPDKHSLYLSTIETHFRRKVQLLDNALQHQHPAEDQLKQFIRQLATVMAEDENFRRLLQRELLDADDSRLEILARGSFSSLFEKLLKLAERASSKNDPHMTVVSIFALVLYHLEAAPIRAFLPGGKSEHDCPEYITQHATNLLIKGLFR